MLFELGDELALMLPVIWAASDQSNSVARRCLMLSAM